MTIYIRVGVAITIILRMRDLISCQYTTSIHLFIVGTGGCRACQSFFFAMIAKFRSGFQFCQIPGLFLYHLRIAKASPDVHIDDDEDATWFARVRNFFSVQIITHQRGSVSSNASDGSLPFDPRPQKRREKNKPKNPAICMLTTDTPREHPHTDVMTSSGDSPPPSPSLTVASSPALSVNSLQQEPDEPHRRSTLLEAPADFTMLAATTARRSSRRRSSRRILYEGDHELVFSIAPSHFVPPNDCVV